MDQLFGEAAERDELSGLELFLLQLRYKEGTLRSAEGNNPFLLDDPASVWVVYSGQVDIFVVPLADGEAAGARRHLYRAGVGHALFGLTHDAAHGLGLLVSGLPDAKVLQLDYERLREMAGELEHSAVVGLLIDNWIGGLSAGIARRLPPKESMLLDDGAEVRVAPGGSVMPRRGVLWVTQSTGRTLFLGREELPREAKTTTPLGRASWLQASGASRVSARTTESFLTDGAAWTALADYNRLALAAIAANYRQDEEAERRRLGDKAGAQEQMIGRAIGGIAGLLDPVGQPPPPVAVGATDSLLLACRLVGDAAGIEIAAPRGSGKSNLVNDELKRIALASYIRTRQVALRGDWWRRSNGPLLAFGAEDSAPLALLPDSDGKYSVIDPATGTHMPVTAEFAATLGHFAHSFYRPFPPRALGLLDLLRFGLRDGLGDLRGVLLTGAAMGALGLVVPVATGFLFDTAIPGAAVDLIWQVGFSLLLIALASALLGISQSIALLRLEGKIDGALQAAIWDRLLALPAPFFRDYAAGDLGMRAMGIQEIRQILSGAVLTSILSGAFSLFSLILLFYYSAGTALVALLLVLVLVLVTSAAGYFQVRYRRRSIAVEGQISGMVLGIISGISKFRVAGLEARAFALWADSFAQQRRLSYRAQEIANRLTAFNGAYAVLAALVIFTVIADADGAGFSTRRFLAFNTAFGQVMLAGLQVSAAFTALLAVVPLYERARPILQALPEVDPAKADPGELAGEIEISHLSFRYQQNGPQILKDVSLRIGAGEFVAFVGASGSGKSTLLRMLLGFEQPESGAIFYDRQDLSGLDLRLVRRQIGVVLQQGRLLAGSLLNNITGGGPGLTIDDAWQAARLAGVERDIKAMPMGMHTMVSEGGSTFSGGQRQRVLIARAIVNRPRIIFFDEATSALDNNTQDIVSTSLEQLQATRVVVAHRLSTIPNADRIFVFDDGRLVQSGTYAELVDQPGPFAELAKRQVG